MNRRILLRSLILTILILQALPSAAEQADAAANTQPWRIGAVAALTGAASGWGEMARMGWELAVAEANSSGGVLGRPVVLLVEDSQTNGSRAVSAFRKLQYSDKVDAMVGDVWDFITTPLIPLTRETKLVLVSSIIDQSTHERSDYFFSTGPRIDSVASAVEQFFRVNPDLKNAAMLSWDNDWGYAYEKVWSASAAKAGVQIVEIQRTADLATDWRAEIARIIPKRPQAIFFGYQADRILRRVREAGLRPVFLTTSNVIEELALKTLSNELSEGVYYTDWQGSPEFIAAFRGKYGREPMLNAIECYEAMRALLNAISLDPSDIAAGMKRVSYQGVSGKIDFTKQHNGNFSEARLYRVSKGEGRLVDTVEQ